MPGGASLGSGLCKIGQCQPSLQVWHLSRLMHDWLWTITASVPVFNGIQGQIHLIAEAGRNNDLSSGEKTVPRTITRAKQCSAGCSVKLHLSLSVRHAEDFAQRERQELIGSQRECLLWSGVVWCGSNMQNMLPPSGARALRLSAEGSNEKLRHILLYCEVKYPQFVCLIFVIQYLLMFI